MMTCTNSRSRDTYRMTEETLQRRPRAGSGSQLYV
jgi:hypothetical protein